MAGPWDKYQKADGSAPGPWTKFQPDSYVDDDDLGPDMTADGREIIDDTDERAGLAIPGTASRYEAEGGNVAPQPNRSFGLGASDTPNPVPAVAALGDQMFRNVPIAGPYLGEARDKINANVYGGTPEEARADIEKTVQQNPVPAKIGEAVGKAAPWLLAGGLGGPLAGALGLEGSLLSRLIWGTASNTAIKTGDKVARGEEPLDALKNAAGEAAIEAPFFAFGTKGGRQVAIDKAPKTSQLFAEGSDLFEKVKDSKLVIAKPSADKFINDTTAKAMTGGLDEGLTPGAVSVVKRLQGMAGRNMSIEDAMLTRRLANDAYVNAKPGSNDARIARQIVRDLDEFLGGVATKGPGGEANMAVFSGDPVKAKTALDEANKVWGAAERATVVDKAIETAVSRVESSNAGMSLEAALKSEFGKLDRAIIDGNPERFTAAEIKLIKEVASGKGGQRLASYLGRVLYPKGPVSALPTLASGGGAFLSTGGDPVITALGVGAPFVVGGAGRALASNAAKGKAEYASAAIRNSVGSRYLGDGGEISPMLKALPSIAGRTVTTMTLEEYAGAR